MKKLTIILAAVILVTTLGIFACNSAKGRSKNNEGLSGMPTNVTWESLVRK
jgi:preprotein translocase subunit SecG